MERRKSSNLPSLQILNLAGKELSSIWEILFIKARSLLTLDLSFNNIETIEIEELDSFPKLANLNLEGNLLTSLELEVLHQLNYLKTLNAAGKQIVTVPSWLLSNSSNSSLQTLDLSNNPFHCDCDLVPFTKWILTKKVTWLLKTKYTCATPESLTGVTITSIDLDCSSHVGFYLTISIPVALVVFMMIFLMIKYRWHIRYKLFLLCRYCCYPVPNIEDLEMNVINGPYRYHAYIAYNDQSAKDERWVLNDLRPNLEEGPEPLKLCIKSRDFIPGQQLIETIYKSIQESRKTILVLTPQFTDSEWCYFETQMAQMKLFQDNLDVLILILLENIPENKMTIALRQLFCKKQYFKLPEDRAGQRLFWQRLKEEIKSQVHIDRRCDF